MGRLSNAHSPIDPCDDVLLEDVVVILIVTLIMHVFLVLEDGHKFVKQGHVGLAPRPGLA